MKKAILISILTLMITNTAYNLEPGVRYGIETNQFFIQSGFGPGTELKIYVHDNAGKRLSVGMYYDNRMNSFGGFTSSFMKLFRNTERSGSLIMEPYAVYNFIYRKTIVSETTSSETFRIAAGKYKSMEHYIGLGLKTNFTRHIYLTTEIGYGLYLGSIMKPSAPDPVLNESYGTNGTGGLTKIGLGFII